MNPKRNLEEASTARTETMKVEEIAAQGVLTNFLKFAEFAKSAPNIEEVNGGKQHQASP